MKKRTIISSIGLTDTEQEIFLKELSRESEIKTNLSPEYKKLYKDILKNKNNLELVKNSLKMLRYTFDILRRDYSSQYTEEYKNNLEEIFKKINFKYRN
jgi:hypothetical protein